MTDKELADKCVAAGVGYNEGEPLSAPYGLRPVMDETMSATAFVSDWRVAGALMEKCHGVEYGHEVSGDIAIYAWTSINEGRASDESLPRAIIEAAVEALASKL